MGDGIAMPCGVCKGRVVLLQDGVYQLFKCLDCGFTFKKGVQIVYQELDASYYQVYNFDRSKEVKEIVHCIREFRSGLVDTNLIEIGCGGGALLNEFRKRGLGVFGFEPSQIAARMALEQFGLRTVVNGYFRTLSKDVSPDIFLAYDLLEHLTEVEVLDLLKTIKSSMDRHSLLVVKSGNSASWNAKLFLSKWSYVKTEQHISFFNKKSLTILSREAGLKILRFKPFRHAYGGINYSGLIRNIIRASINRVVPSIRSSSRMYIELANDHFIAVLSKQ